MRDNTTDEGEKALK